MFLVYILNGPFGLDGAVEMKGMPQKLNSWVGWGGDLSLTSCYRTLQKQNRLMSGGHGSVFPACHLGTLQKTAWFLWLLHERYRTSEFPYGGSCLLITQAGGILSAQKGHQVAGC